MKTKDLAWLAGLLEGEGWFSKESNRFHGKRQVAYPMIGIGSTDLDVIERVRDLMRPDGSICKQSPTKNLRVKTQKQCYTFRITGNRAIQWMMTLYPMMGTRRQSRMKELIEAWRQSSGFAGIYA